MNKKVNIICGFLSNSTAIDVCLNKIQENSLSLRIKYEVSIMDKLRRLKENQLHFLSLPLSLSLSVYLLPLA